MSEDLSGRGRPAAGIPDRSGEKKAEKLICIPTRLTPFRRGAVELTASPINPVQLGVVVVTVIVVVTECLTTTCTKGYTRDTKGKRAILTI